MEESFESSTLNFLPSTALFFFDGWCRQKNSLVAMIQSVDQPGQHARASARSAGFW
jgi:hypothetical protein